METLLEGGLSPGATVPSFSNRSGMARLLLNGYLIIPLAFISSTPKSAFLAFYMVMY